MNRKTSKFADSGLVANTISLCDRSGDENPGSSPAKSNLALLANPLIDRQLVNAEKFFHQARQVHGDKFDYTLFRYQGANVKGIIKCPIHGNFWQSPSNHRRGSQCPRCAQTAKHKGSLKDLCRARGVNYWRAQKRAGSGMSIERALLPEYLRSQKETYPVAVFGVTYPNLMAAWRALSPPASSMAIARWLKRGLSPDEAFTRVPNPGYRDGIIYLVQNLGSGRKYVGLTVQTLERRWSDHQNGAKAGWILGADSLHEALRNLGSENFSVVEIDRGTCKRDLEAKERHWIKKLATLVPHGYNQNSGGVSGGADRKPRTVDGQRFGSTGEAVTYVQHTRNISLEAAKKRLQAGRLDVRTPSKRGMGIAQTPAYKVWSAIVHGCLNPRSKSYVAGLQMHEPWRDSRTFLADVGAPPLPGMVFVLEPIQS